MLTGDLILDQMDLYISSIDEIRLYTYDDAKDARDHARYLLDNERRDLIIQNPPKISSRGKSRRSRGNRLDVVGVLASTTSGFLLRRDLDILFIS